MKLSINDRVQVKIPVVDGEGKRTEEISYVPAKVLSFYQDSQTQETFAEVIFPSERKTVSAVKNLVVLQKLDTESIEIN